MELFDLYGRQIDYLRLSVSEHCNLNCFYCNPHSARGCLSQPDMLTRDELLRLTDAAVSAGISKVRITGGEPLVRQGVVGLCRRMSEIRGLKSLALTTNGVHLEKFALALYQAGLRKVNVSLDTLRSKRFERITGHDRLSEVLAGIRRAEAVGFSVIKINAVVMRGINDDEVAELAALTYKKNYRVRFIELMPSKNFSREEYGKRYLSVHEIIKKIPGINEAEIAWSEPSSGPAKMCVLPGAKGQIGFIAPRGWHFCGSCNRLRLKANGKILNCLFADAEIDIKGPLRRGATKRDLMDIFRSAAMQKPKRHPLNNTEQRYINEPAMYATGG